MSKQTVLRTTLIFSLILSLSSILFAFFSGGDLFSIFIERFLPTFLIASFLMWGTLSMINSVLIKAALNHYIAGKGEKEKGRGDRIDFTSSPPSDLLQNDREPARDKSTAEVVNVE